MMDDTITVLGFRIRVEKSGSYFVMTSEELPGCIGQVKRRDRIVPEMEHLIKKYLKEMAAIKPPLKKRTPQQVIENLKTASARKR